MSHVPFTCIAFTKFIVLPKKPVAVVTRDLLSRFDVPQDLHAGRVPPCRHKLNNNNREELVCERPGGVFQSFSSTDGGVELCEVLIFH